MNDLIMIIQRIKSSNYTLSKFLSDLTDNKNFQSLNYRLQDKIQTTGVNILLELSQIKKSKTISDDLKPQLIKEIIDDVDNKFKKVIEELSKNSKPSPVKEPNVIPKQEKTPQIEKKGDPPTKLNVNTPNKNLVNKDRILRSNNKPISENSMKASKKENKTFPNKNTTKNTQNNVTTKTEQNTPEYLTNLKNNPYFYLIQNTEVLKDIQNTFLKSNKKYIAEEHIFKLCKTLNRNFSPFISNALYSNSPEVTKIFNLTFVNPLNEFKQSCMKSLEDSSNSKFSSIINAGNHWTSLTIVPSVKDPDTAYAIYRDSSGEAPPAHLVNTLNTIYPQLKLSHSTKILQKNSNSCGIFASLSSFGDICIENEKIISHFNTCSKNGTLNKVTEGIDNMIQKKVDDIKRVNNSLKKESMI